jgi:hypothetical protein
MPIKLDCPNCRQKLSVPRKFVGRSATCPNCRSEFAVADSAVATDADTDGTPVESRTPVTVPSGAMPPAAGPPDAPAAASPDAAVAKKTRTKRPQGDPQFNTPGRVARFITPDADKTLEQIATDGKLPELRLVESQEQAPAAAAQASGSNPTLLVVALVGSVGLSVLLLFTDFEAVDKSSERDARVGIRRFYEGVVNPQEPFQTLLREAEQAHSRGDHRTERANYQRVQELLYAEHRSKYPLTWDTDGDKALEALLHRLLGDACTAAVSGP